MIFRDLIDAHVQIESGGLDPDDADQRTLRDGYWWRSYKVVEKFWESFDWDFRYLLDASLVITSGNNYAVAPADFLDMGFQGGLYNTTTRRPLTYRPPIWLMRQRRVEAPGSGIPEFYTIAGQDTTTRLSRFEFERSASATTTLKLDYVRRRPILVDRPAAPAVAVGSATGLTGVFLYKVTFVTADGETLGIQSSALTLSNQKGAISSIPTFPTFVPVTSRKLYRTVNAGSTFKLLTTFTDNTTTTYTDNTADGSLGADAPSDYTGLEVIPDEYARGVISEGLTQKDLFGKGDGRSGGEAMKDWMQALARAFAHRQIGQDNPIRVGDLGLRRYRKH